ncbi:MAG: hypothetical protein HC879_04830 [Leptolyngbyaceae cyanobacterium SL_5_9]|nr:hypothetical protein [Leptolyngbyaceae cyanobacterium SL_5_9]NJO73365.1 hypothetical protein [Leptolyngbyaceae cyanobacterium RM1_406_9]
MEPFVLAGIAILLVITGFYAWFTHRILRELRQENSLYKTAIEKQLKISAFPHLYCDMQCDIHENGVKLEIYNVGNVPAYDLHISAIGAYTEEGVDIATFLRNYVQPRYRKYPLQSDKVGYYGIRSSIRCPMLPFQKRLAIALGLPVRPVDIYVMIQYREILGGNYYQVYCFSDLDEKGNYRANILEPQGFEPIERFHFYDLDDANFSTADKSLPYYVSDFIDLWNHSLSYRLTVLYSDEMLSHQEVHDV